MKTLYLMRHGQTLFNKRELIQGACDSPLTDLGIKQAKVARDYFKDHNITFDHAYSSTSERASDTLELVTDMNYQRIKDIKEFNFGIFESESEDLNPHWPWGNYFVEYGGESDEQFVTRINNALLEIMNKEDHEIVLVAAHGGVLATFFNHWKANSDYQGVEGIQNCTILKFEFEDNMFNCVEEIEHDFSHLDD